MFATTSLTLLAFILALANAQNEIPPACSTDLSEPCASTQNACDSFYRWGEFVSCPSGNKPASDCEQAYCGNYCGYVELTCEDAPFVYPNCAADSYAVVFPLIDPCAVESNEECPDATCEVVCGTQFTTRWSQNGNIVECGGSWEDKYENALQKVLAGDYGSLPTTLPEIVDVSGSPDDLLDSKFVDAFSGYIWTTISELVQSPTATKTIEKHMNLALYVIQSSTTTELETLIETLSGLSSTMRDAYDEAIVENSRKVSDLIAEQEAIKASRLTSNSDLKALFEDRENEEDDEAKDELVIEILGSAYDLRVGYLEWLVNQADVITENMELTIEKVFVQILDKLVALAELQKNRLNQLDQDVNPQELITDAYSYYIIYLRYSETFHVLEEIKEQREAKLEAAQSEGSSVSSGEWVAGAASDFAELLLEKAEETAEEIEEFLSQIIPGLDRDLVDVSLLENDGTDISFRVEISKESLSTEEQATLDETIEAAIPVSIAALGRVPLEKIYLEPENRRREEKMSYLVFVTDDGSAVPPDGSSPPDFDAPDSANGLKASLVILFLYWFLM